MVKRSDDNEDVLKKRLDTYHNQTVPIIEYYQKQGILVKVDAAKKPEEVWEQVKNAVEKCK